MKKMKKFLAMFLAMAMVLGMSVTTFAADDKIGNSDDTGSIKVHGITVEDGVTVTAYQIIKATYDETNGTFSGYELVYPDVADIALEGNQDGVVITEDQLSALAAHVRQRVLNCTEDHKHTAECYVIKEDVIPEGAVVKRMTLGTDGTAVAGDLPVGSYLVLIEGAETKVYNPVVVSMYYDNEDGDGNTLVPGDFDIGGFRIVTDDNVWVKVSNAPHVEKWVLEDDEQMKGNAVNIGDTVEFMVPVTPIPNYGGEYPVFNVVDTLDQGLQYNGELAVYVNGSDVAGDIDPGFATQLLTEGEDYTLTSAKTDDGKTTITIDFVVGSEYKLNQYVGGSLVIMYTATLTKDAAINEAGNENNVVLNYTKDSKINGDDVIEDDDDKTYTYTFDIDGGVAGTDTELTKLTEGILTKTGENTQVTVILGEKEIENVLAEAEFTLYDVNPDTFVAEGDDTLDKHIYKNESGFDGVVVSDVRGQLPVKGLGAGTYYLKETKAPTGYSLNTHVFEIKIVPDFAVDGKLNSWTITIDEKTTNQFKVNHEGGTKTVTINGDDKLLDVEVPNTKLSSLPSTGGIGTTIFTVGGCAIMIIAAGLYFASRRKAAK